MHWKQNGNATMKTVAITVVLSFLKKDYTEKL